MIHSLVIYGTFKPNHERANYVEVCRGFFVRVEQLAGDCGVALTKAKPINGEEVVLNTVEVKP